MKKIFAMLAAVATFAFSANSANAQSKANEFELGTNVFNVGIGLNSDLGYLPPISASYERSMFDLNGEGLTLGLGAQTDFWGRSNSYDALGIKTSYNYFFAFVGARAAVHYTFTPKLDTYAGLNLGATITRTSTTVGDSTSSSSGTGFGWNSFIGARYYFTPNWAANLEAGYGLYYLKLGATYRF